MSDETKKKYRRLKSQAIIATIVFIALLAPRLVIGFTELDSFIGLSYEAALIPQAIGLVIYCYFFFKLYKCPECRKFPGSGWGLKKCNSCGVELS